MDKKCSHQSSLIYMNWANAGEMSAFTIKNLEKVELFIGSFWTLSDLPLIIQPELLTESPQEMTLKFLTFETFEV